MNGIDAPGQNQNQLCEVEAKKRRRTAGRIALVAAAGALALTAGCSSKVDKDSAKTTTTVTTSSTTSTSTSTSTTTTAKATTTTKATGTTQTSTTKAPTTSTTTAATNPDEPTTVQGKGPLPEGDTKVLIVSHDGAKLVVDPVELLTGEAAASAYRSDTGKELDGEFYVRNVKKEKIDVDISDATAFGVIPAAKCCDLSGGTLDDVLAAIDGSSKYMTGDLWSITVAGSTVRGIEQVYTP